MHRSAAGSNAPAAARATDPPGVGHNSWSRHVLLPCTPGRVHGERHTTECRQSSPSSARHVLLKDGTTPVQQLDK
eukprot:12743771-Prorocentrum_lima.AAC.1